MKQNRKNEILSSAFFVVIAICSLGWLIYKFGDLPTAVGKFRSFQVFVQFPTAPGVQRDTPVRFCGYQIGRVSDVMPPQVKEDKNTGQFYHQTLIVLSIDKKYVDIPSNIEAKLMTRGLGSSYIELKIDPANLPAPPLEPDRPETRFLIDKMLLQGSTGMTSEFFPEESQKKLETLANKLSDLLDNANTILGDKQNRSNIKQIAANLSDASKHLANTLEQVRKFAYAGTGTSEELTKAIIELHEILEKVNEGQGSAARIVNDGKLYENILENTEQLKLLLGEAKLLIEKLKKKGVTLL